MAKSRLFTRQGIWLVVGQLSGVSKVGARASQLPCTAHVKQLEGISAAWKQIFFHICLAAQTFMWSSQTQSNITTVQANYFHLIRPLTANCFGWTLQPVVWGCTCIYCFIFTPFTWWQCNIVAPHVETISDLHEDTIGPQPQTPLPHKCNYFVH